MTKKAKVHVDCTNSSATPVKSNVTKAKATKTKATKTKATKAKAIFSSSRLFHITAVACKEAQQQQNAKERLAPGEAQGNGTAVASIPVPPPVVVPHGKLSSQVDASSSLPPPVVMSNEQLPSLFTVNKAYELAEEARKRTGQCYEWAYAERKRVEIWAASEKKEKDDSAAMKKQDWDYWAVGEKKKIDAEAAEQKKTIDNRVNEWLAREKEAEAWAQKMNGGFKHKESRGSNEQEDTENQHKKLVDASTMEKKTPSSSPETSQSSSLDSDSDIEGLSTRSDDAVVGEKSG